eukprot:6750168-Pyramimonas_sp.AAC.1
MRTHSRRARRTELYIPYDAEPAVPGEVRAAGGVRCPRARGARGESAGGELGVPQPGEPPGRG